MPPKSKVTRENIVRAGFELVREGGIGSVNARTIAGRLGCSTQPVLYHFQTVEEIKRAVYDQVDQFHTEYLLDVREEDPLRGIGLNYIRFAVREPNLFRFLFQSGYAREHSITEMIRSEAMVPILSAMGDGIGTGPEQTREIFLTLALFVHGYASLLANNPLEFDETLVAAHLERAYRGAVLSVKEGPV